MKKGPKLNDISKNFTSRDCLGIEGVAASMQAEICPIVNTVTQRAFYWPFMIWIYYDFYKYSGIPDHTVSAFDSYLKRQDYFFVLATMLNEGSDQNNLVGKQQTQIDIETNPKGPYLFNPLYFKTRYGGMQYYNAGCLSMYFITDQDLNNGKELLFPVLRPEGEEMAKAFESVIKDTEYYISYRRKDNAVPRSVLEEYGKVINLGLKGFEKCKNLLRHYMFDDDRAIQLKTRSRQLSECSRFLEVIIKENNIDDINNTVCRSLFYDHLSPSGKNIIIPEDCSEIANSWEIVIGRMYFTSGLEMLWKYMLEQLNAPLTINEWISQTLNQADFNWNLQGNLSKVIDECNYSFEDRESMISATARRNTSSFSIENGLKIILSVYNHFRDRSDLRKCYYFFDLGADSHSISLNELFDMIDSFKEKTIENFLLAIMQSWVIEQHYLTAFDKMVQGRDGFFYEIVNGRYVKKHDFVLAFQNIRMVQLAQVMRDLDML